MSSGWFRIPLPWMLCLKRKNATLMRLEAGSFQEKENQLLIEVIESHGFFIQEL